MLWSGNRFTDYTIREICNMVYFHHVSQFQQPSDDDDPNIEEQIELFEEKIGQRVKAEVRAEKLMRERMIMMGMDPDAKPVLSPELQAKMADDSIRMASDEELMFGGAAWEGKEVRGKKVKTEDDFGS